MDGRKRFALAALSWSAIVALGLGACGGSGSGGGSVGVGSGGTGASTDAGVAAGGTATATPAGGGTPSTTTGSATGTAPAPAAASQGTLLGDCEVFPTQAVFNTRIDDTSRFPALASSANWTASVGSSTPFRADWGT